MLGLVKKGLKKAIQAPQFTSSNLIPQHCLCWSSAILLVILGEGEWPAFCLLKLLLSNTVHVASNKICQKLPPRMERTEAR